MLFFFTRKKNHFHAVNRECVVAIADLLNKYSRKWSRWNVWRFFYRVHTNIAGWNQCRYVGGSVKISLHVYQIEPVLSSDYSENWRILLHCSWLLHSFSWIFYLQLWVFSVLSTFALEKSQRINLWPLNR